VKLFVDTSAWTAFLAPKDTNHDHTREAFAELLSRNALAVTSSYVVDEAVTLLRMRAGHADAVAFRDMMTRSQEASCSQNCARARQQGESCGGPRMRCSEVHPAFAGRRKRYGVHRQAVSDCQAAHI
jgi:uncharacterized protein with PIN domain